MAAAAASVLAGVWLVLALEAIFGSALSSGKADGLPNGRVDASLVPLEVNGGTLGGEDRLLEDGT